MSRFKGKLYLVLLEGRDRQSIRSGRSLWALQQPLDYDTGAPPHERITIPAGFVTDLTSIPRPVWSFYPPDGPWVKGAIVHDFLYYTQGNGEWHSHRGVPEGRRYSRAEADGVLWEAMTDRGVGLWGRIVIWSAVRVGGWISWARKYRKTRPHPTPATLAPPRTTPRIRRRKTGT